MKNSISYFSCSTLVPEVCSYILYTLGFPIFFRGVDYTFINLNLCCYYSLWTFLILQRLGCWLPNLYNFQTFTPIVSSYVVVYTALRAFQQFKQFNVSHYINPQVLLITCISFSSLFPQDGQYHSKFSLNLISPVYPQE